MLARSSFSSLTYINQPKALVDSEVPITNNVRLNGIARLQEGHIGEYVGGESITAGGRFGVGLIHGTPLYDLTIGTHSVPKSWSQEQNVPSHRDLPRHTVSRFLGHRPVK